MENLFFIKLEIILFLLSALYMLYYWLEKIIYRFGLFDFFIKQIKWNISQQSDFVKNTDEPSIEKWISSSASESNKKASTFIKKEKLTDEETKKIIDILKKVKVHIMKWYFDSARALIIEWLAIDKFNKDLNLDLATIYEKEKKYQNAEYIYKDLMDVLQDDFEIKKKLWFNLAMQLKFTDSLKIYEAAHKQKKSDNDVINMLSEIAYNVWQYKKCFQYVTLFLKDKPRDVEKMFMKCACLESAVYGDEKSISEAINLYKKILELQPYNTKARDKLKHYQIV